MSNSIRVPLNSPAFESYVHEGWRQVHVDGLWATLRYDQDRKNSARSAGLNQGGAAENRQTQVG